MPHKTLCKEPTLQIHTLRPAGWESDPADEYFKLSTMDHCVPQIYCNYALYFRLPSQTHKSSIVDVLKCGLEITLSQCRQLCGVLADHPDGDGLCFHKKRESTVEFHCEYLDGPEYEGEVPSLDELESQHFLARAGGPGPWCAERPRRPKSHQAPADPREDHLASAAYFKATFVRGGLVFVMTHQHYASDAVGWAGQLRQLAENCAAIWGSPAAVDGRHAAPLFRPWDPACLDFSRTTVPPPPEDQLVDGPARGLPPRHPARRPGARLLFHLPASKASELKRLASPRDGGYWVSSYDAHVAHVWRVLSRHKARLYRPDPEEKLVWGEAVDMRRRLRDPPVPARMQGNVIYGPLSIMSDVPQLTVRQVTTDAPLTKLAWYIRQLTNSATPSAMSLALQAVSHVRDKRSVYTPADAYPPMGLLVTDWRQTDPYAVDFGFARPRGFRWLTDRVMEGMMTVYPARSPAGADEGVEFTVVVETEIAEDLLADEEWNRWYEFRGVEVQGERGFV